MTFYRAFWWTVSGLIWSKNVPVASRLACLRAYKPRGDGHEISLSDKPAAFLFAGPSRLIVIDREEDYPFLSHQILCPKGESLSRFKTVDRWASSTVCMLHLQSDWNCTFYSSSQTNIPLILISLVTKVAKREQTRNKLNLRWRPEDEPARGQRLPGGNSSKRRTEDGCLQLSSGEKTVV